MTRSSAMVIEALLYCRISSEGQRDGVSLDAQIRETRAYAARQGWVIGREYVDVMSGKRDDRPSYRDMLQDIRHLTAERKQVAVVVWRLDRLGRRLIERLRCREELKALGVPVHSAMEGGEVSDLVSSILGSVAEEEVRVLGERVRGARRQIKASGYHPIADTAFGYTRRDATPQERVDGAPRRVLDVDEAAAPLIREAYERMASGQTIRSVARWLADLPAEARGHRAWSPSAVRRSLQAAVYVARHEREDGGDVLQQPIGKWPALVSDDLWRQVQAELEMNRRLPKRPHTKRLLSGLARCPKCGTGMSGDSRPDKSRPRYRCDDRDGCTVTLNARSLDESALTQVMPLLDVARADGPLKRVLRQEWDRLRGGDPTRPDDRRVERLRQEVERGKKRLADAAIMLVDGALDRAAYDLARARIEADVEAAVRELGRVEAAMVPSIALPPLDTVLAMMDAWTSALMGTDVQASRRVLVELVQRIRPVRVAYGKWDAEITWTPLGEALRTMATTSEEAA